MKPTKTYNGQLTIRYSHGIEEGVIVSVMDEVSRTRAIEVIISFEEFGRALSSAAKRPCTFEYGKEAYIGKKKPEHKFEVVELPHSVIHKSQARVKKLLAPYEIDGWKACYHDVYNPHNHQGRYNADSAMVRIGFRRWVPAQAPDSQ